MLSHRLNRNSGRGTGTLPALFGTQGVVINEQRLTAATKALRIAERRLLHLRQINAPQSVLDVHEARVKAARADYERAITSIRRG